jgi:phosphonate transport system substrate-binding protein
MWKVWPVVTLTLIIVFFISGCQDNVPVKIDLQKTVSAEQLQEMVKAKTKADYYYVGFDRRLEPSEDVKMYVPLLNYLERTTGYKFRLRVFPPDVDIAREIGQGQVQFAIIGPASFLRAEKYGVKSLVIGITENGTSSYRAMIVTSPGSQIKSIQDLRGRTLAFGAMTSTQGYLIPRIMMAEAGLGLSDLASFEFFQSHAGAANAVISGQFDAAALQDTLAEKLAAQGLLRIIATSAYYPCSGISVGPGVNPVVAVAVQKALLEFDPQGKDRAALYQWDDSEMPKGFRKTEGDPYAVYRYWAERFKLLN